MAPFGEERTQAHWTRENRAALARFLRERGLCGANPGTTDPGNADPGCADTGGDLEIRRIGDGHSNLTFAVSDGTNRVVIRRPPAPATPGAHDVLREARLMSALRDTPVPVPAVFATARAGEVIDVPFYVMSFAEGPVVTTSTPAPLAGHSTRREVAEALVDTLASLHAVDWRGVGLGGLGRPDGFNARHVRRIGALVADASGDLPPHFKPAGQWLASNAPRESGAAIVHNDYRIGNVVLEPAPPGRVAAVLDWELSTIGDPLLDVAYFLASVPEPGQPRTPVQDMSTAMLEDGWPGRDQLAARYADRTGADLGGLAWYTAMVQWKLAALYEYSGRAARDDYYADRTQVTSFLRAAHEAAGLGDIPEGALTGETRGETR
jgi:aminoglycoside phosphotransferase (APT) family kinase protein